VVKNSEGLKWLCPALCRSGGGTQQATAMMRTAAIALSIFSTRKASLLAAFVVVPVKSLKMIAAQIGLIQKPTIRLLMLLCATRRNRRGRPYKLRGRKYGRPSD
jgi:hypothetical protein